MSKKTTKDLMARAESAIERKEEFVYDVASETGSIFGNVAHMFWFKREVARYLTESTKTWAHLLETIPETR